VNRFLDRIRPGRKIDANSAVLLPFTRDGKPDSRSSSATCS
jgi:hypothetical protein